MSTKFVKVVLDEELVSRTKDLQDRAVAAGMTYLTGSAGWLNIRREFYPPRKFGSDLLYSNVRFVGYRANSEPELLKGKVTIPGRERRRGTLWFLVGVSDVNGGKVYAAVSGWVLDQKDLDSDLKVAVSEAETPLPIFWYGKTDSGKLVAWTDAVIQERNRHVKAGGETGGKTEAGDS